MTPGGSDGLPPQPLPGRGPSRVSRRRIAARRGIVLGLLVLCVLLFTSFFREGEGGILHRVKGTITAVVAPVQDGAGAAVQPVVDGWNWFAELRTARDEANRLRVENAQLIEQLTAQVDHRKQNAEFRAALAIADEGPGGYTMVAARVRGRPQIDMAHRVRLNKGTSSGIVVNSPVFAPVVGENQEVFPILVGTVTSVTRNSSTVSLITDPQTRIGAGLQSATKLLGLLRAESSGQLLLEQVPREIGVNVGDVVVTSGVGTLRVPSPYPPGLPIGTVSSVGEREPGEFKTVQVRPFRDPLELRTLSVGAPKSAEAKRRAGG